jgi:hypothetical protein
MDGLKGRCLCGAITYDCHAAPLQVVICHCKHCQRQTGSSFSLLVVVPKGSLEIHGDTLQTFLDVGDSGLPVHRHFCGACGSPIMSRIDAMPAVECIKAGTLESLSGLTPTAEVWCETAQPWIQIDQSRTLIDRNPPFDG